MSEGVDLGVDVEVDGGSVWSGKGEALQDVFGDNGVVKVGSVAAVGWCRSVWVGIVMFVVKDVVDISVLVELSIGGLASHSSRIEKCF